LQVQYEDDRAIPIDQEVGREVLGLRQRAGRELVREPIPHSVSDIPGRAGDRRIPVFTCEPAKHVVWRHLQRQVQL